MIRIITRTYTHMAPIMQGVVTFWFTFVRRMRKQLYCILSRRRHECIVVGHRCQAYNQTTV
jgi:hypothetical protein